MTNVLNWLSGKKTYFVAAAYAIDAFGASMGWWQANEVRTTLESVFGLVFLRMGVTKSGVV